MTFKSTSENQLLGKLRLKFMAISVGMVAAVLVVALVAIGVMSHTQNVNRVYGILETQANLAATEYGPQSLKSNMALLGSVLGTDGFGSLPSNESSSDTGSTDNTSSTGGPNDTGGPSDSAAASASSTNTADAASASNTSGSFYYSFRHLNQDGSVTNGTMTGTIEGDGTSTSASDTSASAGTSTSTSTSTDSTTVTPAPDSTRHPEIGASSSSVDVSTPVAVYTTSRDGSAVELTDLTTASISSDILDEALSQLKSTTSNQGFLSSLGLYYAVSVSNGQRYYAFADKSSVSSLNDTIPIMVVVGLLALLMLAIGSLFFSRWALRPVENAWKQQTQFVADASHELKTPLTVILANMQILMKRPDASIASQSQWIEGTQSEAQEMQLLVNDMLELARPADQRAERASVPLGLSDLLEMELLQFESVAFENNLEFEEDVAEGIVVKGDEMRLKRLISTLIDNACKYAEGGGSVDVHLVAEGGHAVMKVHNTGSYISAEDLPHVFDRFYRADKARTRENGSFGLGLAIAHDVAEDHGGSLTVESSPEHGTTFIAKLPLAQ